MYVLDHANKMTNVFFGFSEKMKENTLFDQMAKASEERKQRKGMQVVLRDRDKEIFVIFMRIFHVIQ